MGKSDSVTEAVVEFILSCRIQTVPPEVARLSKRCLIDGFGVILAGSTTPASRILRAYVKGLGGTPAATVLGSDPVQAPAAFAALVNGTAGHAMDFDDTQLSASPDRMYGLLTHPTVPPLAAALALGEQRNVTGSQFLEAFVTGFEVECKIAEAIDPAHYKKGFHTSGTIGAFGAAASAAKLLGLDRGAVAHTIGITASLCSGIRVNFGTMTKPLHVGRAAQNGVMAAELAANGFTASAQALDGPWGFFQILGGGLDASKISDSLGNPYSIVHPGVSVKPYPCGVLGHPSMDAMLKLVTDHNVKPEQIRRIRLRAGSNILNPLRYKIARSELEAKFCPAFMLSSIAINRRAGIHEFTDSFVRSEAVQQMMERVETIFDPQIEALGFDRIRSVVEVELQDGIRLVQPADEKYRGGPERPFTRDELYGKFAECTELVLEKEKIDKVVELIESVERVTNIKEVIDAASPATTAKSADAALM